MDKILNLDLLRSPLNWLIVWLMVLMATALLGLLIPPTAPTQDT